MSCDFFLFAEALAVCEGEIARRSHATGVALKDRCSNDLAMDLEKRRLETYEHG
jgi:hypothetical protein